MTDADRERFDALFEAVLERVPPSIQELLGEVSVIVDDQPEPALMREIGLDPEEDVICGLHSGIPLTERSVSADVELPDTIHIFREGIVELAGGWERWEDEDGTWWGGTEAVEEEIRITLLHEIGHHFGLDEDDLTELGYE